MVKQTALMLVLVLAGCQSLPANHELPQHPRQIEHAPLVVPHRDWIADHCYPIRTQLADGRWVMRKHCEIVVSH
jgi:hypothetical protein